jgi:hypothetical protein
MIQVMNGGFPRLVEFLAIFVVEIIGMFFNFKSLTNEVRRLMRGRC